MLSNEFLTSKEECKGFPVDRNGFCHTYALPSSHLPSGAFIINRTKKEGAGKETFSLIYDILCFFS